MPKLDVNCFYPPNTYKYVASPFFWSTYYILNFSVSSFLVLSQLILLVVGVMKMHIRGELIKAAKKLCEWKIMEKCVAETHA